jgi:2-polyprenyl-6-methoxyphenol hydroxylase-like FAD-dependent oxidoreductase
MIETEVLIIGCGPVGLALAGDLGWRGHAVVTVDKGDGSIFQPKMDLVGIRTMEFCRKWGIVSDVEATAYDRNYPQDNVYLTSLNGYELGRQAMPSMNEEKAPFESPQKRERCPQNFFDPVLQKFAASHNPQHMFYETEFLSFQQDQEGVTSLIQNLKTSQTFEVRSKFLVGCDGGKSIIRETLGIEMKGKGLLTYTTNVIFRCANFNDLHDKSPGYRYMFVGPHGTWATIVAINGRDQWRMSIIGNAKEKKTYTHEELKALAQKALGAPFEMEILSVLPWQRAELVAQQYHKGRVFICGDACHLTSPTGGLGMNTGIGDAVDLSWKLAAVLKGYAGERLLESYFHERQPIAKRITEFSTGNLTLMKQVPSSPQIEEDSPEGERVRLEVGQAMSEGLKREWFSMNMHLGNRYVNSAVCVYDELETPQDQRAEFIDAVNYRPSSRVGARAPHVWLDPQTSTLDLLGKDFVLFCFDTPTAFILKLIEKASELNIPLEVHAIENLQAKRLYAKHFVLIRPDGHVAWRGDEGPQDPEVLWRLVCAIESVPAPSDLASPA